MNQFDLCYPVRLHGEIVRDGRRLTDHEQTILARIARKALAVLDGPMTDEDRVAGAADVIDRVYLLLGLDSRVQIGYNGCSWPKTPITGDSRHVRNRNDQAPERGQAGPQED